MAAADAISDDFQVIEMKPSPLAHEENIFHLSFKGKLVICEKLSDSQELIIYDSLTKRHQFHIKLPTQGSDQVNVTKPNGSPIGFIVKDTVTFETQGLSVSTGIQFQKIDHHSGPRYEVHSLPNNEKVGRIHFQMDLVTFYVSKKANWANAMILAYGIFKSQTEYSKQTEGTSEEGLYDNLIRCQAELEPIKSTAYIEMRPTYPWTQNRKDGELFVFFSKEVLLSYKTNNTNKEVVNSESGLPLFRVSDTATCEDTISALTLSGEVLGSIYDGNIYYKGMINLQRCPEYTLEHRECSEENEPITKHQYTILKSADNSCAGNVSFENGQASFLFLTVPVWLKAVLIAYGIMQALNTHRIMVMENLQAPAKYDEAVKMRKGNEVKSSPESCGSVAEIDEHDRENEAEIIERQDEQREDHEEEEDNGGQNEDNEGGIREETEEQGVVSNTNKTTDEAVDKTQEAPPKHRSARRQELCYPKIDTLLLRGSYKNKERGMAILLLLDRFDKNKIVSIVKINMITGICLLTDQYGKYQFESSGFRANDKRICVAFHQHRLGTAERGRLFEWDTVRMFHYYDQFKKSTRFTMQSGGQIVANVNPHNVKMPWKVELANSVDDDLRCVILAYTLKMAFHLNEYNYHLPNNNGVDLRCECLDCALTSDVQNEREVLRTEGEINIFGISYAVFTDKYHLVGYNIRHNNEIIYSIELYNCKNELIVKDAKRNVIFTATGLLKCAQKMGVFWADGSQIGYILNEVCFDNQNKEIMYYRRSIEEPRVGKLYLPGSEVYACTLTSFYDTIINVRRAHWITESQAAMALTFAASLVATKQVKSCLQGLPQIAYNSPSAEGEVVHLKLP